MLQKFRDPFGILLLLTLSQIHAYKGNDGFSLSVVFWCPGAYTRLNLL